MWSLINDRWTLMKVLFDHTVFRIMTTPVGQLENMCGLIVKIKKYQYPTLLNLPDSRLH